MLLDGYRLGHQLGRGEEGIVYQAVERATGLPFALKLLHERGRMAQQLARRTARVFHRLRGTGAGTFLFTNERYRTSSLDTCLGVSGSANHRTSALPSTTSRIASSAVPAMRMSMRSGYPSGCAARDHS